MSIERLGGSNEFDPGLKEKCGLFGIYDPENDVAPQIVDGLTALQHRGQEAAGISIIDNNESRMITTGDSGLVREVFHNGNLDGLRNASFGMGHTRYGTIETDSDAQQFQPFTRKVGDYEFAVAHNGNLTSIDGQAVKPSAHGSDTAQLANKLASHIETYGGSVLDCLPEVLKSVEGAYSLIIMDKERLIAVRDRHGFRPLSMAARGKSVMFASETGALDIVGGREHIEIESGEVVSVDRQGKIDRSMLDETDQTPRTSCIIEHVYFSHESHEESGASTVTRRVRMGNILANEFPLDVDVVAGVPGTGLPIAEGYSQTSGTDMAHAIIKNPYLGRSFIQPNQQKREELARQKFQVVRDQTEGRRLAIVDDSIVRGTNTKVIVEKLRAAGALEVHFLAASPPYRHSCYFGVDTGRPNELLANRHSGEIEQMRQELGVDSLGYLSIEGLKRAIDIDGDPFCDACMSGNYPVPVSISHARH